MKKALLLLTISVVLAVPALSQSNDSEPVQHAQGRMGPGGFERRGVMGKVTAVSKDSIVVQPISMSEANPPQTPITVLVSDNTRVTKQREPIKLSEIKVNDTVFVGGPRENDTIKATAVGVVPPEFVERMRSGEGGGRRVFMGGPGGQFSAEDMGKKFIAGTVKAINETKLTISRPDGQTQDIEVDENTSFRKARESITFPDIKVGDFVFGRGELKNNVFVPAVLNVGQPQMRMLVGGPEGTEKPSASANDSKISPEKK
jgi:uncharacterized protein DUF5666